MDLIDPPIALLAGVLTIASPCAGPVLASILVLAARACLRSRSDDGPPGFSPERSSSCLPS